MFSKKLPPGPMLFCMFFIASVAFGVASVSLAHPSAPISDWPNLLIGGSIVGIITLVVPVAVTAIFIKLIANRMAIRHLLFMSAVGGIVFDLCVLLGGALYPFFGPDIAVLPVILGAASIYGWWFFAGKVIFSKRKSPFLALVQSTLSILFYVPSGRLFFSNNIPTNVLLLKLYAGMLVFAFVIYAIIYIFNRPIKRGLGIDGVGAFSDMLKEWLFGISSENPFAGSYGHHTSIRTDTIIFKKPGKTSIFFIPNIHYGVMGNIGGSNFPYLLERHCQLRYKSAAFIMHPATNEDTNPVASMQISKLYGAIRLAMHHCNARSSSSSYLEGAFGKSRVVGLSFGGVNLVILSRAPAITEDFSPDAAELLRGLITARTGKPTILIDAHNSRYESASKSDLAGVRMGTNQMRDYMRAVELLKPLRKSNKLLVGIASTELYVRSGAPKDLGHGNLNVAAFGFGGFRYVLLQFNSNNMLPSFREEVVGHIKSKFGVSCEVLTTDTHAVNSMNLPVSNVLGRHAKFAAIRPTVDECIGAALADLGEAKVCHTTKEVSNFVVWGPNAREKIFSVLDSVSSLAKILVPTIIALGFAAATWIIYIV